MKRKTGISAAVLDEKSTLYDDLAPILVLALRDPDLLRDVLFALNDPATADLGQILAFGDRFERAVYEPKPARHPRRASGLVVGHRHIWQAGRSQFARFGCRQKSRQSEKQPIDFAARAAPGSRRQPDAVLQQRRRLREHQNCHRHQSRRPAKPCTLFRLDDLALYYLLSIASDSVKMRTVHQLPQLDHRFDAEDAGAGAGCAGLSTTWWGFRLWQISDAGDAGAGAVSGREQAGRFFKTTLDFGACSPAASGDAVLKPKSRVADLLRRALFDWKPSIPATPPATQRQT